MKIVPDAKQDWWSVPILGALPINTVPGVKLKGNRYLLHRSHLPLLEDPEAARIISPIASPAQWLARDLFTDLRGFKLRTVQQQGIDFIAQRRGTLLTDEMRVGKTLTSIMSHHGGKLVVIAPLSARGMWLGWLKRVFPDTEIGVMIGRDFDPEAMSKPIVFGHYDVIHSWQGLFKIGTLILDEAHYLINRNSRRALAAGMLASTAERVIAMTGTPIWKMPPDLWNVLGTVAPGAWGSYYDFANRYGLPEPTAYGNKYTGISNEAELKARLSEVMLRRRWVDVATDIPPITRSVTVVDISEADQRKLDIITTELSERSNTAGALASYRRAASKLKVPAVARKAIEIMDRGQPVVIWTWHVDTAKAITAAINDRSPDGPQIIRALCITGDDSAVKREQIIKEWRESLIPLALVANMAIAAVAIDLSHSYLPIFAEIDWTPGVIGQAEMRTFDPTRPMDVLFIVLNHLVEQRIVRALVNKLSAADPVGMGAAGDAIDALRIAVLGKPDDGDMCRLIDDLMGDLC